MLPRSSHSPAATTAASAFFVMLHPPIKSRHSGFRRSIKFFVSAAPAIAYLGIEDIDACLHCTALVAKSPLR